MERCLHNIISEYLFLIAVSYIFREIGKVMSCTFHHFQILMSFGFSPISHIIYIPYTLTAKFVVRVDNHATRNSYIQL